MRYLRKRLTVVNRFPDQDATEAAMDKVRARYVENMEEKGWELYGENEYSGNRFLIWEHILYMRKPNKKELELRGK